MDLTWAAIAVGVVLFLLAVGIPHWLRHRRLHPRDTSMPILTSTPRTRPLRA